MRVFVCLMEEQYRILGGQNTYTHTCNMLLKTTNWSENLWFREETERENERNPLKLDCNVCSNFAIYFMLSRIVIN